MYRREWLSPQFPPPALLGPRYRIVFALLCLAVPLGLTCSVTGAGEPTLWSLRPIQKPEVPKDIGAWNNPIDAFIASSQIEKGVRPLPRAEKLALLRRVSLDLIGLPPSLQEQDAFLNDPSADAYEAVVARLLDSPQHGVRYARHWLDVMRYADVDENMPAGSQLHLWRDWVITALNEDVPYDDFVRAQITGYRDSERTTISATGFRRRKQPRPDDVFALGFLSRGATSTGDGDEALALSAVETISSTFLGMTVGCAKCHDHFYDPIEQRDFYAMKALFDPLVLQPLQMATRTEIFDYGRRLSVYEREKAKLDSRLDALVADYHKQVYEERVLMLPPDVQAVIRKPAKQRTVDEQKTADEYYPILRIDPPKLRAVMPKTVAKQYDKLREQISHLEKPRALPVFWAVGEEEVRKQQERYVLNSGDAKRPEKDRPVEPGFPFAQRESIRFTEGLREGFADWLTAPENPLFARVAVNRVWLWHFGQGLHESPSDFGELGGVPLHPELLDWLAAEWIDHDYSMKWLHRKIVTSETYMRASAAVAEEGQRHAKYQLANETRDPQNRLLWRFPLRRLAAEPIWDAIHWLASDLDLDVGGASFSPSNGDSFHEAKKRRAAYMKRGFRSSQNVMPEFLRVFDVEDGRNPCPMRQQSVTAPQSLLLLNSPLVARAASRFANRIAEEAKDLPASVTLAYRLTFCRPPSDAELNVALEYLGDDPSQLQHFCGLLFNLDEFIYVP